MDQLNHILDPEKKFLNFLNLKTCLSLNFKGKKFIEYNYVERGTLYKNITGLPHTHGTQGVQENSGNFQIVKISGRLRKLREV